MAEERKSIFWRDTFREEVEAKAAGAGVVIWALGGPCFALRVPGGMIYLDAFLGPEPPGVEPGFHRIPAVPIDPARITLADGVLISHDHYDHCHEATLKPLERNTGALFCGPASAAKALRGWGIAEGRIHQVAAGDELEVAGASVRVWPGYDEGEPQAVTYVVEAGGVRVFFGGDTSAGPAFDEIGEAGVDVAMCATGRTWYMDEAGLLDAAARLRPKVLVPYHWELWRGHTGDPVRLGRLAEGRGVDFDVQVMLAGDWLEYRADGTWEKGP